MARIFLLGNSLLAWLTVVMLAAATIAAQASLMGGYSLEELEYGRSASSNADFARGHDAFDKGDIFNAIEAFKKAADAGDVKAQTNLGILYLFGWSRLKEGQEIANSRDLAMKYLTMAADNGDPAAHHYIGYMHDPKIAGGGDGDMDKAIEWYRKAMALGYDPAKDDLYGHFTSDFGFNLEEALKLTDWQAAYKGDLKAQYDLAFLYWRASGMDGPFDKNNSNSKHQITALKWMIILQKNEDKAAVKELLGDEQRMYHTILGEMQNPDVYKAVTLARTCAETKFLDCGTPGPGTGPAKAGPSEPAGDWYAVAGAFKSERDAAARSTSLGAGWGVLHTSECPNFRDGYWIAAAGPLAQNEAKAFATEARQHKAYAKKCR